MNKINEFYRDKDGNEKFNDLCIDCPYDCKQSFRVQIYSCKLIKEKRRKK